MIKCTFRDVANTTGQEVKKGRYHRSNFWDVKGFGKDRWVIAAYLELENDDFPPWMSEEEVVEACLEYLNAPPPRQIYEKKKHTSLYGTLRPYQHTFKKDADLHPYIEVILITDQRTNPSFWGKGKSDKF